MWINKLLQRFRETPPAKLMLLFAMAGMTALFLPLVIYYLASSPQHDIQWPNLFTLNSFIIILSSIVLEKSYRYFRSEDYQRFRIALGITLLLGIGFLVGQYFAWQVLHEGEAPLSSMPQNSIFYIISGLHALHLLGGVIFLLVIFVDAFSRLGYVETFIHYINVRKQVRIELLRMYWHYLGILWVLLFSCFLVNQLV